jgi:two-component system phosphate regulon sensor histidine kinase PhoR
LNPNPTYVWLRTIVALATIVVLALLVEAFFDPRWALGLACAGVLAILAVHLGNVSALLRWVRDPSQPVPDRRGVWEEAFSELYRLVRSHQRERETLSAELARFRMAGTAMPDGVVILDAENHIEWCNPMAERFFDIDTAKDAGQSIMNLVRAPEFALYLERGNFSEPLILRLMRGEGLVLSMRIIPYGQDQKLLLSRDVTQAEKVEVMRRDFVANVSHELKTPLTVVSGFLETLSDGKVSISDPRAGKVMTMMQDQTDRMLRLIDDLLTLSALESTPGPGPGNEQHIDMAALLSRLVDDARALSAGRHRIELDCPEPMDLTGSEKELHSAFGNLVSNAIRYSPDGGSVRLSWGRRASGEGEFAVADSGIGIDARHIARLTERFYRVDQGRSRDTGGTGLGLAIVKHVLSRHQATLDIQSTPGQGSRFAALFPARRIVAPLPAVQPAAENAARS